LETIIHTVTDFRDFLHSKDSEYREQIGSLILFRPDLIGSWSMPDKKRFASVFYHIRGYFIDFMWYIANFTDSGEVKAIIMDNMREELGVNGKMSHEQLYAEFASCCGVDIQDEIINKTNYLPFARQYNKDHMVWLAKHNNDYRLAAFAAYERLDNIDYDYLYKLSDAMELSKSARLFFKVHTLVEHFEPTIALLEKRWAENPDEVKEAFDFIYNHQLNMWKQLSSHLFESAKLSSA
jgi:pyrroloquinoline quinone (PQQ) biosynthesis protein C